MTAIIDSPIETSDSTQRQEWDSVSDSEEPCKRILNLVLHEAIKDRASDIYFEKYPHEFKTRYRTNGELLELPSPPRRFFEPVSQEIMGLFGLIHRRYKPQRLLQRLRHQTREQEIIPLRDFPYDDVASTSLRIGGREIGLNLTRLPSRDSDNYHIEIFDARNIPHELDTRIFEMLQTTSSGLIVLSSPQDGGKTTTACQMLNFLNSPSNALVALERKPAYPNIAGISWMQLNPRMPDYSQRLEAVRNYHPSALLFDDLSDPLAAREAISYARTGKLVIAAMRATGISASLEHLASLGIGQEQLAASLRGLITQRLVRTIHTECRGRGCIACHDTGHSGRREAYRILPIGEIDARREKIRQGDLTSLDQAASLNPVIADLVSSGSISEFEASLQRAL